MRDKLIDYFIGEPEEVTESEEFMFYVIMASPVLIGLVTFLIILF